jgi:hypothetical protein
MGILPPVGVTHQVSGFGVQGSGNPTGSAVIEFGQLLLYGIIKISGSHTIRPEKMPSKMKLLRFSGSLAKRNISERFMLQI